MSGLLSRETEETERLVTFSDGVFAIAITLLVLDISVPTVPAGEPASVLPALVFEQWHELFGYVFSFLVIGSYWVLHRRVFVYIEKSDKRLVWLNLLFLLFVAFVPYATSLFTAYPDRFGVMFYAGTLAATGFLLAGLWATPHGHASYRKGSLPVRWPSELRDFSCLRPSSSSR
ncbi:TMEM175 family protein [Haladaptatus sp. W1]|uniref:TMEM175 family protein n=1 Tax=Haladaptatus sp. W1 TaxID=1897478 RepID=UPI000A9E8646|nr:TMEM175 family protein [Haladaptatus sp. W1]